MSIDDRDDKIEAIRKSLSANSRPNKKGRAITVQGDQNVVGDGNTVHIHQARPAMKRIVVVPGDGAIGPAEKSDLKTLVAEIASLTGRPHGEIWSKFNRFMRVNTYHSIKAADFKAAKAKLMQWRAAARKTSDGSGARKGLIAAIQTRWKQYGTEDQGRAYMRENFGVSSLTELTLEQLREVDKFTYKAR